jgi:hypothetical protein
MDHHRMLLLSILFQLLRCLLGLTAVLVRRDLRKDAELLVLRHENVYRAKTRRPCGDLVFPLTPVIMSDRGPWCFGCCI